MKRFFALLLVVVLTITSLSVYAFGASTYRSGYTNGKYWNATVSLNGNHVYGAFTVSAGKVCSSQIAGKVYMPGDAPSTAFWSPRPMKVSEIGTTVDAYTWSGVTVTKARMQYNYKSLSEYIYADP